MYEFVLLSSYYIQLIIFIFLFYVHQTLAQNVGTSILVIKRPSGISRHPLRDRRFLPPPHPVTIRLLGRQL